jgi:hypothetical protein
MRHITLFILTFFVTAIASAMCMPNGIYCLNENKILNKNGLIILEFYGTSESLVSGLNKKYPIYLKTKNSRIQLNVLETLKGDFNLTQVVLKPVSELIADNTYSLEIDKLPKFESKPERYDTLTHKYEDLTFKVSTIVDNDSPILNLEPTEQKKSLVYYGCGPAIWVYFTITGHDKSELFIRANVKSKKTGKVTTYILAIENGLVKVGHGMCSGAFLFYNDDNFEVIFQLFDQSGNKSAFTNTISFTKPTTETKDE